MATSIKILIQKAREAAEIIVDNDYEKQDFELYLNQSKENVFSPEKTKRKKRDGKLRALIQWIPFIFTKKFPFIKIKKIRSGFSTKK